VKKYLKAFLSVLLMLGLGLSVAACETTEQPKPSARQSATAQPRAAEQSETAKFLACVRSKGTEFEKLAARNVTKVTGADKMRGYLDMPKIFTSYSGGMFKHSGEGVLLASAFATCYTSENGLVTVYDRDGHVLGNGQF
jgi:hypothetical protein